MTEINEQSIFSQYKQARNLNYFLYFTKVNQQIFSVYNMALGMNIANGLIVVGVIMILLVFGLYYLDRTNTANMSVIQIFAGVLLFGGWILRKRIQRSMKENVV